MGASLNKREAIKEYKARKPLRGIFAVRCRDTGEMWVGSSPNLDAARNGLWFGLRIGSQREATLQAAWNAHGEGAFDYEILEKLDEDLPAMNVRDVLKDRKAHWSREYGAPALL